jgi:phospholipid-binding lipoprotein MlaA
MSTHSLRYGLACLLLMMLCGCATVPRDPIALAAYRATDDPLEPMNRKVFAFNQGVDKALLKPVAKGYVHVLPARGRDGIRNFIKNLNEPVVLANNILQGQFKRAWMTTERFVLNSVVGVVGIMDFAGRHGLPRQIGDFGQTLYVWRFHAGPYLVVPIFGPTTPRDGIGSGVDILMDPFLLVIKHARYRGTVNVLKTALGGIDERARNLDVLDEVQHESVDFYAAMRSLYRQNREAELRNGGPPPLPKDEDLYSDPGADPAGSPDNPADNPADKPADAPQPTRSSPQG